MSSPGLELQAAVVAALRASTALQVLLGSPVRLYQDVPDNPAFPYATIGDAQQLPDKAECINGSEIYVDVHAFSRGPGDAEIKNVAAAVSDSIDDVAMTLTNHRCLLIQRENAIFRKDPDTLTRHAILTFKALTEPLN